MHVDGGGSAAIPEERQNSTEAKAQVSVTSALPDANAVECKKIVGKVTRVIDGDTIWVTDTAGKHKIRLEKIDAPERDQPYGHESTQFLESLIYDLQVEVQWTDKDQYGRILGIVYFNGEDVNLAMVKNGYAWHYSFNDNTLEYAEAEKKARQGRRGLWAAESPINPYEWRKARARRR